MGLIHKTLIFLRASDRDIALERGKITRTNLERLNIASLLAIFLTVGHSLYFHFALSFNDGKSIEWKEQLFLVHSCFSIFFILSYIISKQGLKSTKDLNLFYVYYPQIAIFIILLVGAIIAAIDQKVTTSATPYILVCVSSVFIINSRPIFSFINLFVVDIIFILLMQYSQPNEAILASNIVNGISISFISLGLSFIQWKNTITNLVQAETIENQKFDLEKNYVKVLQYSNELEAANVLKDKFFSIVAHDFKGPLSSIIGVLDILLDKDEKVSEEEQENLLLALKQSTSNTYKMLENVLLWARNQNGSLSFLPVVIFLQPKVESILEFYALQAKEKKVTLNNSIAKNTVVFADIDMLNTILRNLISNALKFSLPLGRIEVGIKQNLDANETDFVHIYIKDNGVGMSKQLQADLFRIDKTISKTGTNNETGTGLGLILCKDFVEKNGGKLSIESSLTDGTTVHIQLPKKISLK